MISGRWLSARGFAASSGNIAGGGLAMARLAPEQRFPTDLTDAQWRPGEPVCTRHRLVAPPTGESTKYGVAIAVSGIAGRVVSALRYTQVSQLLVLRPTPTPTPSPTRRALPPASG